LERVSEGRLRLAEAQGSLWSGSGWLEIRDGQGRAGAAKPLKWRVLPASLLRGHLVAEVRLDQAPKPFPVTLSLSRIEIADASLNLPAAAFGVGLPKLAPLGLTGDLLITIPRLSLERGRINGDATLQWRRASSTLTSISPLGEYEVRFDAAGTSMQGVLRTLEGPLQLEGKGSWSNAAPPSFLITARIAPQHQEQLGALLRLIAVERGTGSFEINSNKAAFGP
jgi:general secretion pathway protein N